MKKFYITTSIAYANSAPHIGYAMELIHGDILARLHKEVGEDVFYLTGTDEHGSKIARAAADAGLEPRAFVEEKRILFKKLTEVLNISNSDFISTADKKRHWPGAQKVWKNLEEKGDIYKGSYKGLYCIGHESFITEKDLIEGKCPDHNEAPQMIEEENYFFKLSKYTKEIEGKIKNGELKIVPETRQNEILSLLAQGLDDVSFSRPTKDVSWGIPVPGDDTQTMYVWCDALSNYISAIGYGSSDESRFKKYWPADVQVIGKDILRFHAAIWPAMLIASELPLPKSILVHGFIQVGGRKMSKSIGNVIDPFDLVLKYGTDPVRYYFSREISVFEDGDFTQDKFERAYEGNLVNGIGNYIQRVSTMIRNYFESEITKPSEGDLLKVPLKKGEVEYVSVEYFVNDVVEKEYKEAMDKFELNQALDKVFMLLGELDGYVQTYEPFKLIKTDKEKTRVVLWNLAYGSVAAARLLSPFLPETADRIYEIFGVDRDQKDWSKFSVKEHKALFPRIEK